ncbi:hypothetical protein HELRODRAFT_160842 [Helobdella robusta]|uniref:DH domain-containing protein n=1 Tax=Helobdella robusta TaxID=6412 RepID=T1EQT2_HELRO|nr:hypothetical protein HELRODRAFT_160842 [Helobdella robusta]ESO06652.1 hypothetical protein HELRODRAFT_160842 [Helobdella robusta]
MNKRPLSLTSSSSSGSILNTTTTNNNNNIDNNNSYDSSSNNDHQHKSNSTTSPPNFATSNLLSPKKHQAQQLRKKFLPERPSNPSGSPHPKAVFCNSNNSFIRNSMYNGDFGAGNLQKMKKYSSEGSINLETSSSSLSTSSLSFDKSVVFNKFLSNLNILDSFEFKFSFESVHRNIQKAGSIADMIESKSSSEKTNYLLKIIEELLETEKNYEYKQPIGSCKKFGQMNKNCDVIFSNIEELLKFNSSLLNQLSVCEHDPEKISLTFVENNKGFYLYATYCSDYPTSLELIKRCMKSATTASHVHDMQKKLNHRLPLVSYLLKPVQRISNTTITIILIIIFARIILVMLLETAFK